MALAEDISKMREEIKSQLENVKNSLVEIVGEEHKTAVKQSIDMTLTLAANATMLEMAHKMKTDPNYKKDFMEALEEDDD